MYSREDAEKNPNLDSLAEEVAEIVNEIGPIVDESIEYDASHDLHLLMKNETYRKALVRLYSVLLEVDMRKNPDRYSDNNEMI